MQPILRLQEGGFFLKRFGYRNKSKVQAILSPDKDSLSPNPPGWGGNKIISTTKIV